jgi:DNA polymerase zeta
MTTFESVEALWEDNYRVWKPTRGAQEQNPYAHSNGSSPQDIEPVSRTSVEVDEALLSSQELSSLEEQGDAPEPNLGTGDKDNSTDEDQVEDADTPSDIQIDEHSRRGTPQPPQRPHSTTPVSSQQSNKERLVTPRKRRRAFLEATTE